MTVKELGDRLGFECLHEGAGDREVTGGYAGDLLSWVMGKAEAGSAWITIMSNVNVAAVASLSDVSCIVLAEEVRPDEALTAKFHLLEAAVFTTTMSAFEASWQIHRALE